ncbi:MAG: hypothetical protein KAY56_10435 [Inhella sp.]|jgi:hypothetical protein|nr:hypothetical protein [Inhella sp.]
MSFLEWMELASYLVTIVGLPFAVFTYMRQERAERENEDEEAYLLLADAYDEFLKVVLANSDLQLRTQSALPDPTPEQQERMQVIFEMLVSLFERAYLVAYQDAMSETGRRRWNSWHDTMQEWCEREDFRRALPELLSGEDPDFRAYIERLAVPA